MSRTLEEHSVGKQNESRAAIVGPNYPSFWPRMPSRPPLFALGVFGLMLTVALPAIACGPDPAAASDLVSVKSLEIRTPLFVFDGKGRLRRGDLTTDEWTDFSDHGFDATPTLRPSADGRWISYSGELRDREVEQYWLFDKRTGSERLYREVPGLGEIPEFSPDGRTIVLVVRREGPAPQAMDIESFDTKTMARTVLGSPGILARSERDPWASVEWSADGRELLIMAREMRTQFREHFTYKWPSGPFDPIDGDVENANLLFFRKGKPIATYLAPAVSSHVRYSELKSPDGRWLAKVSDTHELTVRGSDGSDRFVARGEYDMCEGITIGIHGWIDARHFVYSISSATYVFDAETGKKALLFPEGERPYAFTW